MRKFLEEHGSAVLITFIGIVLCAIIVPNVIGLVNANLSNTMETTVKNAKDADGDIVEVDFGNTVNYLIEYDLNDGDNKGSVKREASMQGEVVKLYNSDTETFTIGSPVRDGYYFDGWEGQYKDKGQSCDFAAKKEEDRCTKITGKPKTITVQKGSERDYSLKATWTYATYKISYEGLKGATLNNKVTSYTIDSKDFSLGIPTKTGWAFAGWTGSNGKKAQLNVEIKTGSTIGDLTYEATWKANKISLAGKKFTVKYSKTMGSAVTFDEATNGTGKYTYEIASGNNKNYFSIKDKVIVIKSNTPVGTYNVNVKATDSESEATVTSLMQIEVTKGTLESPKNLKILSTGSVTWDSADGADSYSISLDNGATWIDNAKSGYNAKDELTKSTGTKTVQVKAIASKKDSNYNSSDASKASIEVYGVSVSKDGGVKEVSGTGNYLAGSSATLSATFNEGYKLKSWNSSSTDANYKLEVNKNESVSITSEGVTYSIKFNANSGTGTMTNLSLIYDKAANLTRNAFEKYGYEFTGWNTKADGSGTTYADKASVKNLLSKEGAILNLYAQWEEKNYNVKVTYVSANTGKQISSTITTVTGNAGETKTVEYIDIPGYTKPSKVTKVKLGTKDNPGTTTLEVKYTPTVYTITYNLKGGSLGETNPSTYTIESETITLNEPTMNGYKFAGWTGSNGTKATTNLQIKKGSTGNKTYTANWSQGALTLTLDPNGGKVDQTSISINAGEQYGSLPAPTRDGYFFEGWYTLRTNGRKVSYSTVMGTSNTTIFAHWSELSLILTIDPNEGNINGDTRTQSITLPYNTAIYSFLETPSRDYYDFKGWSLNGKIVDSTTTMPGKDATVTATWQKSKYTLTIDNGSTTSTKQVTWGENLLAQLSMPSKEGYTFTGWTANGTKIDNSTTMPTKNITVKANWSINSYTVNVDLDGGEGVASFTLNYGETIADKLSDPSKEGYTFTGWTIDGESLSLNKTMPAKDVTIVATWEENPSTKHTLTIKCDQGGEIIETRELEEGEAYGSLPSGLDANGHLISIFLTEDGQDFVTENTKMGTSDVTILGSSM